MEYYHMAPGFEQYYLGPTTRGAGKSQNSREKMLADQHPFGEATESTTRKRKRRQTSVAALLSISQNLPFLDDFRTFLAENALNCIY